jgi:hypothetical protein
MLTMKTMITEGGKPTGIVVAVHNHLLRIEEELGTYPVSPEVESF